MDDFESLFDTGNVCVIETEPVEEVVEEEKFIYDPADLLQKARDVFDGNIKESFEHNGHKVLGSDPGTVLEYDGIEDKALDTDYEPYDYQKESAVIIDRIFDKNGATPNILVSSPTGSGKTYLIKWAAVRAAQCGCRLVIGTPLVALSEQIFGELRKLLKGFSVEGAESPCGIRTGPSEKFPDAPILVCTYEIINIQVHLDPSWLANCPLVIIDEIHFMQDPDRGCQLESIIMGLPNATVLVGLSGTIPNARQFAKQVTKATQRDTTVVGLRRRPIRLRYYAHLGGRLTEICFNRDGTILQRWKQKAWDWVQSQTEKRPRRLNPNQTKGRILQLVRDLEHEDKLPGLVVSFSCNGLDSLGAQLYSVDLTVEANKKSYVHRVFMGVKKMVPEEEWPLFLPLMDLAKRGIAVHHSRQPKTYLEVLPDLVKKNLIRLVLATSTLSTGIDLPMRTVVLLSLMQPKKGGFKPIEPSLLFQIFGRAGRPGMEKEGHAIIACWSQPDPRVDVKELLCSPSAPVCGHGLVRPRHVLSYKVHNKTPEELLMSPFSSVDHDHVYPVLEDIARASKTHRVGVEAVVKRFETLAKIREDTDTVAPYIESIVHAVKTGDKVVVDPEGDDLVPPVWTVTHRRPLRVKEYDLAVPAAWVLDCVPRRAKKCSQEEFTTMKRVHDSLESILGVSELDKDDQFVRAKEAFRLENARDRLQRMVAVESHPLWPEYTDLVTKLQQFGFLDENKFVTPYKGRLVPTLVGCDDPVTLVEAWVKNILPRECPVRFSVALTCFLQNKRHRQPKDGTGLYDKLCELQHHVGDVHELGTSMMAPIQMWMEGKSVCCICQTLEEASPGHVCKTVQRLIQLLKQMQEAGGRVNDDVLVRLCDAAARKATRGLPFVESIMLNK